MKKGDKDNSLPGRVKRYASVGATMGGLAARLAGERYLGVKVERGAHAAQLRAALGNLKGPLMKLAQLAATIPGAIPEEYAGELAQLQADAPPMGWPFVKRRMAAELGPDWQGRFESFDKTAARAASLGQVHRAVAPDGRALACKLQYPDMGAAVEADLGQFALILKLFESYDRVFSTRHVHEEVAARLREELDYGLEARHMALYADMLADEPLVTVPAPVPELSTRRLLTMEWVEGRRLTEFESAPQAERDQLAMSLFRAWYVPFYHYGVIHGDPHLGNYTVRPDLGLNLLDFGCVRTFRPAFVQGVIDLYRALKTDDTDLAIHAFESWGFKGLKPEVVEILLVWAHFLYDPVLHEGKRRIGRRMEHGVYGQDTAARVHKALRAAGADVVVPREFVFMDRAALGLGSVFLRLEAEVNWHDLFHGLIGDFDARKLARRQKAMLTRHDVPLP